jgi:hypothetical protein
VGSGHVIKSGEGNRILEYRDMKVYVGHGLGYRGRDQGGGGGWVCEHEDDLYNV